VSLQKAKSHIRTLGNGKQVRVRASADRPKKGTCLRCGNEHEVRSLNALFGSDETSWEGICPGCEDDVMGSALATIEQGGSVEDAVTESRLDMYGLNKDHIIQAAKYHGIKVPEDLKKAKAHYRTVKGKRYYVKASAPRSRKAEQPKKGLTIDPDPFVAKIDITNLNTPEQVAKHNTKVAIVEELWGDGRMPYFSDIQRELQAMNFDKMTYTEEALDRVGNKRTVREIYEENYDDELTSDDAEELELSNDIFEWAKTVKGTTHDINEAGYILPDGDLLDYSGKNVGGPAGKREEDHRQIDLPLMHDASGTGLMNAFMKEGAIRILTSSHSVDLAAPPTPIQISKIREVLTDGDGVIDLRDGDRTDYIEVDDVDDAIRDIRRFYASTRKALPMRYRMVSLSDFYKATIRGYSKRSKKTGKLIFVPQHSDKRTKHTEDSISSDPRVRMLAGPMSDKFHSLLRESPNKALAYLDKLLPPQDSPKEDRFVGLLEQVKTAVTKSRTNKKKLKAAVGEIYFDVDLDDVIEGAIKMHGNDAEGIAQHIYAKAERRLGKSLYIPGMLCKGKRSREDNRKISEKVKILMDEGYDQDQAVAIAISMLERGDLNKAQVKGYYKTVKGKRVFVKPHADKRGGQGEDKSKGHIVTVNGKEYFDRGGEVYRAPLSSVIMPDGYRSGRWECSRSHFDTFREFVTGEERKSLFYIPMDLCKAPGDRGGNVVRYTKTGKPVYDKDFERQKLRQKKRVESRNKELDEHVHKFGYVTNNSKEQLKATINKMEDHKKQGGFVNERSLKAYKHAHEHFDRLRAES